MKAQLIKTRNHFLLSAASGLCAVGRRLPDHTGPPRAADNSPDTCCPDNPVASSPGMRSWEMGICRAAKSSSVLPGRLTPLDAFPLPDCRAFGLRAMSSTVSGLWVCNPGLTKLTPGGCAATNPPPCSLLQCFAQPHAKISPSPSHQPAPQGRRSWLSPWQAANRQEPPSRRQGGCCWYPAPPPRAVLEALASSNHGYARQRLDRVRVLHAEN